MLAPSEPESNQTCWVACILVILISQPLLSGAVLSSKTLDRIQPISWVTSLQVMLARAHFIFAPPPTSRGACKSTFYFAPPLPWCLQEHILFLPPHPVVLARALFIFCPPLPPPPSGACKSTFICLPPPPPLVALMSCVVLTGVVEVVASNFTSSEIVTSSIGLSWFTVSVFIYCVNLHQFLILCSSKQWCLQNYIYVLLLHIKYIRWGKKIVLKSISHYKPVGSIDPVSLWELLIQVCGQFGPRDLTGKIYVDH